MYTRKYKEYLNDFQKTKSEVSDEDLPLAWFLKEDTYLKINAKGSHIIDFFRGKCVFITGGSGFLGRILIEKLLRACDDIDTIYMLIRDKKGKDGDVRLQEMFDSDVVFSKVKELRPNCLSKITVMKGDVSLPGLGLSTEDTKILQDRVNVIIHGAATVRFDAKIREAVNINIKGTLAVIALAEQCKNLASFVHISTAFSNCPREEIDELFYDPPFSVEEIIDIVDRNTDDTLKLMQPKLVGEFPNTYTLTKCVAESVIRKHSEVLPISLFRPSIVITTYREPLKSWINNIYGPIGMAMGSGIGLVHTFNADLSKISDMVPCDFVANAILAVAYKTAQKNAPKIYNYVSSAENPLSWFDFERQIALNGQKTPSIQCLYVYSCYYTKYRLLNWFLSIFLHLIPGALIDMFFVLKGDKPKLLKAYKKVHKFNSLLRFFSTQEWTFKNENTQSLWKSLSEEDREAFTFSVKELDWHIYCITALLGCRCYIIKDELSTIAAGRKIYKKLRRVHYLSEELGYVLYSALGSFYIPSCIMVFVYIRIYYAAKARARRGIRKPPRRQPQDAVTSFTNTPGEVKNGSDAAPAGGSVDRNSNTSPRDGDRQIATIEAHPRPIPIPTVTCDLASDISTSDAGEITAEASEQKDTLKNPSQVFAGAQVVRNPLGQCQFRGSTLSVNGELQQQAAALARARQPSMGIDTDMVSEFDPSSSDSGVVAQCTAVKPLKLRLCKPIFGRSKTNSKNTNKSRSRSEEKKVRPPSEKVVVEHVVPRVQKPRDPEREKRRIARKKEKRATLILGLIMGSFIACWLPFFFMYILRLAYHIPPIAFSTAFWLGYMNSALNPVIYTIFNKDFRRAFRRILFK